MDVSAIAAIAKEVRINAKAKETGNDKTTLVLLVYSFPYCTLFLNSMGLSKNSRAIS